MANQRRNINVKEEIMFQIYRQNNVFALFFDEIEIGNFTTIADAKSEAANRKGSSVKWIRCNGWWEGK